MGNPNIHHDDTYYITPGVYKLSSVFGRSVDSKGHQICKRINFPPSLVNAVNQMYPKLGYPTMESFIRDAVVHRLHYWQEQEGVPAELEGVVALLIAEARFQEFEAYELQLNTLRQNIGRARGTTREFMLAQLVVFRDTLPDYLSGLLDEVNQLIKNYE